LLEETRALRAFFVLLEREKELLQNGAVDELLPLVDAKSSELTHLNMLGLRRSAWLAAAGYGSGRDAAAAWLAGLDHDAAERSAWREMIDVAERVRDLNEGNGALMRSRLQHNRQALAVLLAAGNHANLYGPDGHPRAGLGRRDFGAA
jgi:flagella synthesis protein FlgN